MVLSWIFGLILLSINGFSSFNLLWLKFKFFFVIVLTAYHLYLGKCLNDLKNDNNQKSSKFYRIINEIPTILLILIVLWLLTSFLLLLLLCVFIIAIISDIVIVTNIINLSSACSCLFRLSARQTDARRKITKMYK